MIAAKTRDVRSAPIRGWSLFTPAVLEAKARRETPLPQPNEIAHEHASTLRKAKHHKSAAGDSSNARNAAVEKLIGHGPRRTAPTPDEVALALPVTKLLAASLAPAKPARAAQLITRLIAPTPGQLLAIAEAPMRVIRSAATLSRTEECFDWLMLVDPQDARIVWLRADGMRWRQVCYRAGVVRSTAWRRWAAALLTIERRNGS